MNTIEELANLIEKIGSAVIFTHVRPDGDTLGSAMALHRALSVRGIASEVVNEGTVPEKFCFLPGLSEVKNFPSLDADAYIAVDTSDLARLGALEEKFRFGARRKMMINIDHHISNTRYCKYNFVRERASNCENIAELIRAMGVSPDREIAQYLMLGMVTDSGAFSHSDVDGDTLRAAADALDCGADLSGIIYRTMKRQSKSRAAFYAEVISRLRYFSDDTVVAALITQEQLARYGLTSDATEGIVDFGLSVDGVLVSVCLLEMKKGQYKVSLRSTGRVNVNDVARTFGGGGHVLASGCMLFGDIEEIYDRLCYAIWQNAGEV